MSGTAKRGVVAVIVTAVILVAVGLYIGLYLINVPGSAASTPTASGANLYLGTVPASKGTDPHPTWVSYYVVSPDSTYWRHDTTFTLPANTLVHVTIYQFDGQSGLRNGFLSQATGTVGGNFLLNGKPTQAIDPATASHVFAIPAIGLAVPLEGIADGAKNPCAKAPSSLRTPAIPVDVTSGTPATLV